MALSRSIQHVTRLLSRLSTANSPTSGTRCTDAGRKSLQPIVIRHCSTYDPYQKVEDPPSPFKQRGKDRIGYKLKIYTGGKHLLFSTPRLFPQETITKRCANYGRL